MIIVLGNKVELSGEPSKRLQYRLNKSYELFQSGMGQKIIVSGGIGKEGFDEAKVMASYLIEKGVPTEKIIRDNEGNTTYDSALNCRSILNDSNAQSVIVVSQYFHLLRSKIALRYIYRADFLTLGKQNFQRFYMFMMSTKNNSLNSNQP